MKRLFLTMFMALGVLTFSMATANAIDFQDTKTEIKMDELPAAVQQAVSDSDYSKWSLVKVYKVADAQTGGENYEIHVEGDGKKVSLTYNAAGELLAEEEV